MTTNFLIYIYPVSSKERRFPDGVQASSPLIFTFPQVDVGRFADLAAEYHINTSSLSRQLPTLIMFQVTVNIGIQTETEN